MDYELEQRVDAFVRGESDVPAFIKELCAVCAATPDFAWDVLAITDQYHRRGKISADLNRTIRHAIERPALARQAPEFDDATPMPRTVRIAPIAWTTRPAASPPTAGVALQDERRALQDERRALRSELDASRRTLLRYRARLAKLAAFGRSQRNALANLRRELEPSRIPPRARFAPGLYAALHLAPWDPVSASPAADVEEPRTPMRWIRPSQVAASIVLLLTVTASPALRETPMAAAVMPTAVVAAPAAAPPPGRQHLSLDRERYLVAPRDRQAVLRVQRTGGSSGDVNFTWWTRSSGAKSGIDFRGRLPTVERLPDGVDVLTIYVPIIVNPRRAHTELFYVEIGHPTGGAAIGAIGTSAVIIMPTR
jgi:hypothetical protein